MSLITKIKNIFEVHYCKKKWRNLNKHNNTWIEKKFDLSKVEVGHYTYGPLDVYEFGTKNEKLIIRNYVSIAKDVKFILGGNHRYDTISTYPFKKKFCEEHQDEAYSNGPIVVNDDSWIGINSIIMSGVTIGKGAVIAAGSVVTKDVPEYAIVGGNPAKIIKYRFEDELRKQISDFDLLSIDIESIKSNVDLMYTPLDNNIISQIKKIK